jgi:hypothetical protein
VRDNVVAFGEDHVIFVAEGIGKGANELEQAVAGRRNVRAVLNVCRRPELLCSDIVAFVKKREVHVVVPGRHGRLSNRGQQGGRRH